MNEKEAARIFASMGGRARAKKLSKRRRLEIARAVMTAIPDRDQLMPGNFSGEMAGHPWRIDVLPFVSNNMEPQNDTLWAPQTVVMTVRSPAGAAIQVSTVRIQRRNGG